MDFKEVGCHARNCMVLAQDQDQWCIYVRAVLNPQVPQKLISLVQYFYIYIYKFVFNVL